MFRNETVDATHLAEFHQVEGVIADKNLTLGDLIGFMNEFFGKMGIYFHDLLDKLLIFFSQGLKTFALNLHLTLTLSPAWRFSLIMKVS